MSTKMVHRRLGVVLATVMALSSPEHSLRGAVPWILHRLGDDW